MIVILGNGGFGTALACHCAGRGHDVFLWGHDPEYTGEIARTRRNERYLPGVALPDSVRIGSDAAPLADASVVLSVVPTQHVRSVWTDLACHVPERVPVVSCSKGIEEATGLLPTDVLSRLTSNPLFVLTGPCHAEELARGKPATVVLAGANDALLERLQNELSGAALRIYRTNDPLGAELGAALKNIIGIAAGICDGLELGDNAKSALLTRGLAEIARFGIARGARRETFYGLAGIGDLLTTSFSPHGRNRALGERVGRGDSLDAILDATKKVAEGVWTCRAVLAQAEALDVDMPISREVGAILFDGKDARQAVTDLMTRILREED